MTLIPEPGRWMVYSGQSDKPGHRTTGKFHAAIRHPTAAPAVILHEAVFRVDIKPLPDGRPRIFTPLFDKASQTLRLVDPENNDVQRPWSLADLTSIEHGESVVLLASLQGLVDQTQWEQANAISAASEYGSPLQRIGADSPGPLLTESSIDTFNLEIQLRRGVSFSAAYRPYAYRSTHRVYVSLPCDRKLPGQPVSSTVKRTAKRYLKLIQGIDLHTVEDICSTLPTTLLSKTFGNTKLRLPTHNDKAIGVIPYISALQAVRSQRGAKNWLIDAQTPNTSPYPPSEIDSSGGVRLPKDGASSAWKESRSPETFRIWSLDLQRDMLWARNSHGRSCATFTGEEVKKRWPTLWKRAKKLGYWKELEE